MGPSSRTFLVVLTVAIVVVAVVIAGTWNRGSVLRRTRNGTLLVVGQVLTAALLLGAVNVHEQFYNTWDEVFGVSGPSGVAVVANGPAVAAAALPPPTTVLGTGRPGTLDAPLSALRRAHHGFGSLVSDITIPGAKTGYRWRARAYLPAAYFARAYAHRTFPVVEMFSGGGGGPSSIFGSMPLQQALDGAIAAGTLPPLIAVSPTRNPVRVPDSQCLDDPHGFKVFTYVADDVPAALKTLLRVRQDRGGWVTMGNSSGGFCAADVALQRPQQFATVVSLSGYFSAPLGKFPMGDPLPDQAARLLNTPVDRVRHVTQPVSFILVSARDDKPSMRDLRTLLAVLKNIPADHAVAITTPTGGHSSKPWRETLPTIIDTLGQDLWRSTPAVTCGGQSGGHRTGKATVRRATPALARVHTHP
ncbi:MAG TPA: alpha/beta hydrolase-fold protein [Mycobacteriales bacterium]